MERDLADWRAQGVQTAAIPMRRGLSPWDLRACFALRAQMRESAPDIVHAHATKAGLLVRLARPAGVKVVYSPHSFAFEGMAGVARRLAANLERWLASRTGRFVFVSAAERDLGIGQLNLPEDRCRVVENGLPADWADGLREREDVRRGWGVPEGTRVLAVPARLARQKGHDWLFQALAGLGPAAEHLQVRLLGEGPEEARLRQLADELGIARLLVWDGYVPEAGSMLRGADLVVLPSRHEGLSYALLEAMAAGVPLLVSDIPANVPHRQVREILHAVPFGDVAALTAAITDFLHAPNAWREQATGGPALVRENWSLARQTEQLIACYREL
jgi:glycosyltransferase involved in cell wall biosynthesis